MQPRHSNLLYVLACLLFPLAAHTQAPYILDGTITDEGTGEGFAFVNVLVGKEAKAVTSESGKFRLELSSLPDSIGLQSVFLGPQVIYVPLKEVWPEGKSHWKMTWKMRNRDVNFKPVILQDDDFTAPWAWYLSTVTGPGMERGDGSSVGQAINQIPGLKFEQRGPGGSRRLAIRSSHLRAPYGGRDVKVYLGGLPLTSPDGFTPLELLDPAIITSITANKGPNSASVGPMAGGSLDIYTQGLPWDGFKRLQGRVSQTVGSMGYRRTLAGLTWLSTTDEMPVFFFKVNGVRQEHAGYRDQEANDKYLLQGAGSVVWDHSTLQFDVLGYQGKWELPGSLDSSQVQEDPRQALAASVAGNAFVARRWVRGQGKWQYDNSGVYLSVGAYSQAGDKENPYATSSFNQGYKVESNAEAGGNLALSLQKQPVGLSLNAEVQQSSLRALEYTNAGGLPTALRSYGITRSSQAHLSLSANYTRGVSFLLTSASIMHVGYRQSAGIPGWSELPVGKVAFPFAGAGTLAYNLHHRSPGKWAAYGKLSSSYSPPSVLESVDSLGRLRSDIDPESALNIELCYKRYFNHQKGRVDIIAYRLWGWNSIVPTVLSSGRTHFENQGQTRQFGLEGIVKNDWKVLSQHRWLPASISASLLGTLQHYLFADSPGDSIPWAGNTVPGIPAYTATALAGIQWSEGPTLEVTAQLLGPTFLDNLNSARQQAYLLLNLRATHTFHLSKKNNLGKDLLQITPSGGINNILNTRYTDFPNLNAAARRYYNPAPGINAYLGLQLAF